MSLLSNKQRRVANEEQTNQSGDSEDEATEKLDKEVRYRKADRVGIITQSSHQVCPPISTPLSTSSAFTPPSSTGLMSTPKARLYTAALNATVLNCFVVLATVSCLLLPALSTAEENKNELPVRIFALSDPFFAHFRSF